MLLPTPAPFNPPQVRLVQPWDVPKLGRGGTPASRISMLHSLVHIEGSAVDLAWDVIARFGPGNGLPRAFWDDFVAVAQDEARHFTVLEVGQLSACVAATPHHLVVPTMCACVVFHRCKQCGMWHVSCYNVACGM